MIIFQDNFSTIKFKIQILRFKITNIKVIKIYISLIYKYNFKTYFNN
jgi:hypothetical protein